MSFETWFSEETPPWAPLPDLPDAPTVAPTNITINVTTDDVDDVVFGEDEVFFTQGFAPALFLNNAFINVTVSGLIWSEDSGSVEFAALLGRNVNVLYNQGAVVAISEGLTSAYAVFLTSWGIMNNSGSVQAIAQHGTAIGYMSYSQDSWQRDDNEDSHINTGLIEAWAGVTQAYGAILWNGGTFENSGTVSALAPERAIGVETVFNDTHIINSGLIEAYDDDPAFRSITTAINNRDAGGLEVTNTASGIIRSNDHAIYSQPLYYNPYTITNAGLIEGDISLFKGPTTIINSGTIIGNIRTDGRHDFIDSRDGLIEGTVFLHSGNDTYLGGASNENVNGAAGDDLVEGGAGDDTIWAGYGADTLDGGAGDDMLVLHEGFHAFSVDLAQQSLSADHNGNAISIDGFEHVLGSGYADTIRGSSDSNRLDGGRGDDFISGLEGNDTLTGGEGSDIFYFADNGGADVVTDFNIEDDKFDVTQVSGVSGFSDLELQQVGNDLRVTLPDGSSILFENLALADLTEKHLIFTGVQISADGSVKAVRGAAGNDTLSGQEKDDTIVGGDGSDQISGNAGNDIVWAGQGDEGSDTIEGGAGNDILSGGAGDDLIIGGSSLESSPGAGGDTVYGGTGDDTIVGGNMKSGAADNTSSSRNALWAGDGDDRVTGDAGADRLGGGANHDFIDGGAGDDTIFGGKGFGDDTILGGEGDDLVFAGQGSDQIYGNDGNDIIFNGGGFDFVDGGAGNDTIWGGASQDNLTGGEGADVFIFEDNNDVDYIQDFEVTEDKLDLTFFNLQSFEELQENFGTSSHGLTITMGTTTRIVLVGLEADDLTPEMVLL